ncbi:hypothetical protein [Pseudoflavonifractor sp. An184]|uniref:hypothetical protein n=1 Tax=Pseudoflavonifractor sp. An184 TaxID=1965576 RepID=UPI001122EF7D|nr:hypothetical protein [Pseudoflavonifractor sp. An184]MBS5547983.1 hypothetical protein [Oscillospiraceae bacterium]HIW27983.1 hypothetical protein [Candidatus Lawsonibacter pullicola]
MSEYGHASAHPELTPGGFLVSFWASKKKLAAGAAKRPFLTDQAARAKKRKEKSSKTKFCAKVLFDSFSFKKKNAQRTGGGEAYGRT